MIKVRRGGGEEIPLVQGKGKRLCFAGAAVKIYPTPKVLSNSMSLFTKIIYTVTFSLASLEQFLRAK